MSLPRNLTLLRHGESEGNWAKKMSEKGDHSLFTPEFRARHSSTFHLTNKGIEQAKIAGDWIRKNIGPEFDGYYTSDCTRALETAAWLRIPFAQWDPRHELVEREWGDLDIVSDEEKGAKYREVMEARQKDGFFWRALNIEPMSNVCLRVNHALQKRAPKFSGKNVIVVCHGEIMWAFRMLLEGLTSWEYARLDSSTDKKERMLNCQILQYTREEPALGENPATGIPAKKSKKLSTDFTWMRSVCATDPTLSSNIWTKIERKKYSNAELLKIAESTPRMIN